MIANWTIFWWVAGIGWLIVIITESVRWFLRRREKKRNEEA